MAVRLWSVAIDANDPTRLGRFWADALGWVYGEADGYAFAEGGAGTLTRLECLDAPNERTGPSWMHFDLSSSSLEDQRSYVARLLSLGATHLDVGQEPDATHVVLADPEGNAFCVLEPTNRFVDRGSRLGALSCDGSRSCGLFWRDVLGWPLVWDEGEETGVRADDGGVFFTFGGPPGWEKTAKNRFHVDLLPLAHSTRDEEVDRLLALGAVHADVGQGDDVPWVVL
ncbi:MAG TPA: VOC family protein, partial [Acidimicrobiales bacterium]|nr:VOC family protein [Acidimicrobiales bacterium]